MSDAPLIELKGATKSFNGTPVVDGVSLRIEAGALCVLVGPSGCGKSTTLRMINAMIAPDAGVVEVRGRDVASFDPTALRRSIGYVIQSVGLFPHWTVAANIGAVPQLLGWDENKIAGRVAEIADALQIDPSLLPRYPRELSGGQQQRVGVARALAADPDILLMDEPFAALDPLSRAALQNEVRRLHAAGGRTIVFVTHDMNEALRLASQIVVMNAGRIVQAGDPAAILLRPQGDFVRSFLGGEDLPLKLLDLSSVGEKARPLTGAAGEIARPFAGTPGGGAARIAAIATLRQALALMLERRSTHLLVENDRGEATGEIDINDIVAGHDAN
jgi:osmoprotectant transport system ATP-binding protein